MMAVVVSADRCCLPSLLAIATIAVTMFPQCASSAVATGQTLAVSLNYTMRDNSDCIGGQSQGLTDTSVLLQYRTVQDSSAMLSSDAAPLSGRFDEWSHLANLSIPSHNSTYHVLQETAELRGGRGGGGVGGLQFRLLQLEHGGDECNCWGVHKMSFKVTGMSNLSHTWIDNDTCFESSRSSSGDFCGGVARKSRGRVSRVFFLLHDDNHEDGDGEGGGGEGEGGGEDVRIDPYCGNYSQSLFYPQVPSLLPAAINCTEMTPRM